MKIISDHRRCKVYFDPANEVFIKKFYPKWKNKLKYTLKLRRAPGENFNFIAGELNKIGLKTPKVIEYSDYSVTMEKVNGVLLRDYLKEDKDIVKKFLDTITLILKSNIHFGDFNTGNFMVADNEIYIIDLEDYRKVGVLPRKIENTLSRLEDTLKNKEWSDYVVNNI